MSQRGAGGRGRASRGRAIQKQTSSTHQQEQQQLPHAQASTSIGTVRKPGQPAIQSVT